MGTIDRLIDRLTNCLMLSREEVVEDASKAQPGDKAAAAADPAHEQQRWMASAETWCPLAPQHAPSQPLWGSDQFRFLEMHYPALRSVLAFACMRTCASMSMDGCVWGMAHTVQGPRAREVG